MVSKMTLWVTTQLEGFHKWEQAPDEVAYLRERHRHMFGVSRWLSMCMLRKIG